MTHAPKESTTGRQDSPKTAGWRVRSLARIERAVEMRVAGYTLQAIGDALEVSRQRAWEIIIRHLDRVQGRVGEKTEKLRAIQNGAIDRAILVLDDDLMAKGLDEAEVGFQNAIDDNSPKIAELHLGAIHGIKNRQARAVSLLTKLWERQARLNGLDAPIKQDITNRLGTAPELLAAAYHELAEEETERVEQADYTVAGAAPAALPGEGGGEHAHGDQ